MFNFFRNKNKYKPDSSLGKKDNTEEEQDMFVKYIYSKQSLPKQHRQRRVSVDHWEKFDGDIVKKGEYLGELKLENEYSVSIKIDAPTDGVIEFYKYASKDILNPTFLEENDKVFTIYKDGGEQKVIELKNKRFKNIPIVKSDEFLGTKEIKWESVAGQKKSFSYDPDIYDSFMFFSDENQEKFMVTLNNIDNKDYIVFKYPTREYKLTIGAKISFLFENKEIIYFEIINKPYKYSEHIYWGHIYEIRVPLTTQELETLKTQKLSKWQIEFARVNKKITGAINSPDIQFAIKKFANDYHCLVLEEIKNYLPFTNKEEEIATTLPNNEECYVYLMIDLTNNYHKIGISNKPKYREKTLQSEKPTIEMLCSKRFPNRKIANSFEQALHQVYVDKRVRGEWFDLTNEEINELKDALMN